MAGSFLARVVAGTAERIDRSIGWPRLPSPLGLLVLIGLRDHLREKNLYDTGRGALDKPPFTDPDQADYRNGDVERVDVMIGMYAGPKPKGFGFSDTAFRVFILKASRRIESDRFLTTDYRPEIYTRAGFDWVEQNTMRDVLLRHFPELAPALEGVGNPFAPWAAVAPPAAAP